MKAREAITCNGNASFYAAIWNDLRQAALDCGWALGLHGSLASDLDIMAMPWTEDATSADKMVKSLVRCFDFSDTWIKHQISVDKTSKPNNRVVYTIPIFADYYIDLNIIQTDL